MGAIEKSPILILQYGKIERYQKYFTFWATNNIFAGCIKITLIMTK